MTNDELSDFTNAEVGDIVWSILDGFGTIFKIDNRHDYPIKVEFNNSSISSKAFSLDGKYCFSDINPTLYKQEMKIVPIGNESAETLIQKDTDQENLKLSFIELEAELKTKFDDLTTKIYSDFETLRQELLKENKPRVINPKLEVDTLVWVWDDDFYKHLRYFKEFEDNGKIVVFDYGATSKTAKSYSTWHHWELYEETK